MKGIPGVKMSLLGEFGVRLVSYDLPGFGESDPHPDRNLNSSAFDMLYLANAVGISDKFWVLGHSSGSMHAWAALKYIPDRIAGISTFSCLHLSLCFNSVWVVHMISILLFNAPSEI
jgi:pimeloyl-ACP methyl ester carboxylesterase